MIAQKSANVMSSIGLTTLIVTDYALRVFKHSLSW